jgi:hypothetical protein
MTGLLAAAFLANPADLVTFLRVNPALIPAHETSPLPHLLGQTVGGLAAKMVVAVVIGVIVVAFRGRPRTRTALLIVCTVIAVVGAVSNVMVGR